MRLPRQQCRDRTSLCAWGARELLLTATPRRWLGSHGSLQRLESDFRSHSFASPRNYCDDAGLGTVFNSAAVSFDLSQ
jgi:hypothetical protein